MNSSRPLLQAATKSAASSRPRRRVRPSPSALPPARDLIGQPCPLSNLRPVYYAPLFPSLHSPSGWGHLAALESESEPAASTSTARPIGDTGTGTATAAVLPSSSTSPAADPQQQHSVAADTTLPPRRPPARIRKPHPYSLAEFPTVATSSRTGSIQEQKEKPVPSSLLSDPKLVRLERVRQSLHAQDLEWRWARYRFDAFNQAFWTQMNERFLRSRDAYLAEVATNGLGMMTTRRRDGGDEEPFPPRPSAAAAAAVNFSNEAGGANAAVDLAPFYARHLAETKRAYADYNKQLWRFQAGLIMPAVRASLRSWRWRYEVWRAGPGATGIH
ncbi:hypothetical protein JCM3774_002260 [Rhodotorula dairenensis]